MAKYMIYVLSSCALVEVMKQKPAAERRLAQINKHNAYYGMLPEAEYQEKIVPFASEMVETVSLMSGEKVMIQRSLVGSCCDPSTERYWSM